MTDTSQDLTPLLKALAGLQHDMKPIAKDATGQIQNRSYKYNTLTAVRLVGDPILDKHGLYCHQREVCGPETVTVFTTIYHVETGLHLPPGEMTLPAPKRDPQAFGLATTYARRYGYMVATGMVGEDDDGASARAALERETQSARPIPPGDKRDKLHGLLVDCGHTPEEAEEIIQTQVNRGNYRSVLAQAQQRADDLKARSENQIIQEEQVASLDEPPKRSRGLQPSA